jgi:ubiquinol-cytochrome c reductase cytochrome c subunit
VKEDFDVEGELGFEPAVPVTGADRAPRDEPVDRESGADPGLRRMQRLARGPRSPLRRRLLALTVLLGALGSMGAGYAVFASSSGASSAQAAADDAAAGKQLYQTSCITCHGANLQGVKDRGIPLVGVGGAAVYFQVSTGRMPLAGQGAEANRKTAKFDEQQIEQLAAYIESVGGGPVLPKDSIRGGSVSAGGDLFRLNCASCHGTTFRGAPLSAGHSAPGLYSASDKQIYSAMLSGPENMPVFSDNQLTPQQKQEIVNYVQTMKASKDPGGNGIGRIGPVSEAIVIWVVGVGALAVAILWIGAKNQ